MCREEVARDDPFVRLGHLSDTFHLLRFHLLLYQSDHDPHQKDKKQHGGAGGKGKWNDMDDGTLDE